MFTAKTLLNQLNYIQRIRPNHFFLFFFLEYGEPFFAGGEAPALYSFNKYFNKKMKKYRTLRVFCSVYYNIYYILSTA